MGNGIRVLDGRRRPRVSQPQARTALVLHAHDPEGRYTSALEDRQAGLGDRERVVATASGTIHPAVTHALGQTRAAICVRGLWCTLGDILVLAGHRHGRGFGPLEGELLDNVEPLPLGRLATTTEVYEAAWNIHDDATTLLPPRLKATLAAPQLGSTARSSRRQTIRISARAGAGRESPSFTDGMGTPHPSWTDDPGGRSSTRANAPTESAASLRRSRHTTGQS